MDDNMWMNLHAGRVHVSEVRDNFCHASISGGGDGLHMAKLNHADVCKVIRFFQLVESAMRLKSDVIMDLPQNKVDP